MSPAPSPPLRVPPPPPIAAQALVTVVVSLSSFGADFEGGLFVTTGAAAAGGQTAFVALQVCAPSLSSSYRVFPVPIL